MDLFYSPHFTEEGAEDPLRQGGLPRVILWWQSLAKILVFCIQWNFIKEINDTILVCLKNILSVVR